MSVPVAYLCGKDPREEISGGHSSYVRAHARAAVAAGFEPHLFCVGESTTVDDAGFGTVHRIRTRIPPRQLGIPWHGPRLARAVRKFLDGEPDAPLLHGFGLWGWAGTLAARAIRRRGRGIATVVHAYTSHTEESRSLVRALSADPSGRAQSLSYRGQAAWSAASLRPLEREMLREADCVAVNYDSVRRLLERSYGPLPRCRQLPYCAETAFASGTSGPRPTPAPIPLVVTVARHESRKGIGVLLRAFRSLRSGGTRFRACIAGGGPLLETHRRLAADLGLEDAVEIAGPVEDAFALLRRADVFVLPSLEEQSGSLALLEALQAGTPAIVSGVDGILEDVEAERSAVVVPPGDSGALAAALSRMLRDPALRKRIAAGGTELHRRRFSAAGLVDALGRLYAEFSPGRYGRERASSP